MKEEIVRLTRRLAAPLAEERGCELWDVEYVREAGTWYLRVLLDKTDGGVDILDCEAVSRALSDRLDEEDPIEGSYILEVGSAGAERPLKRPSDFQRFLGSPVLVKLYRRDPAGRKEIPGVLERYDPETGAVGIRAGDETVLFDRKDVALVRLRADL